MATAASHRRSRKRFDHSVEVLLGATRFSDDTRLQDPVWLVTEIRRQRHVYDELIAKCCPPHVWGRRRAEGDWPLLYLAYVHSAEVEVTRFYTHHRSSPVWEACGFTRRPSYQTVWLRFAELEHYSEPLREVAGQLIQRARRHDDRVGQWVDIDGTATQSHAGIEHVCPDRATCRKAGGGARRMRKLNNDAIAQMRADALKSSDGDTDDGEIAPLGGGPRTWTAGGYRYQWASRHLYRYRDETAALRKQGRHGWLGFNKITATDRFTGAALAHNMIRADIQEWDALAYDRAIAMVTANAGEQPLGVVDDRGFSVSRVFEHNTRLGIASVLDYRKPHRIFKRARYDTDRYDRYGVLRCKHCGGETQTDARGLGFYFDSDGQPRIRARCLHRNLPSCDQIQSVACSENWKTLVPLSRATDTYWALKKGRRPAERVHRLGRERAGLAGSDITSRVKRRGIAAQQLRADAAMLIEWFLICLREGWSGSARTRHEHVSPVQAIDGATGQKRFLKLRRRFGLDLRTGPPRNRAASRRRAPRPPVRSPRRAAPPSAGRSRRARSI